MSKKVKSLFVVAGMLLAVVFVICLTSCDAGLNGSGYGKTFLSYDWMNVNYFNDNNSSIPSTVNRNTYYEVKKGTYKVKWGYTSLEWYLNYTIDANEGLFPKDKNFKLMLYGASGLYDFTYTEGDRAVIETTSVENPVMYKTTDENSNVEYSTPIETGSIDADGVIITWEYGKIATQE